MKTLFAMILFNAAGAWGADSVILNCRISKIMDQKVFQGKVSTLGSASQVSVVEKNGVYHAKLGHYATFSSLNEKGFVKHSDLSDKDLVQLSNFGSMEMFTLSVFKARKNGIRPGRVVRLSGSGDKLVAYLHCQ